MRWLGGQLGPLVLAGLWWWAGPAPAQEPAAPAGYRQTRTRVVVEGAHWRAWEIPDGSYALDPALGVEPRLLRSHTNAALDAGAFEKIRAENDTVHGGIRAAGSNPASAPLTIDGDPDTWWEPDRGDDVADWSFDLDLGRTVIARQVRVRFAADGDPFLKFRVMISDGRGLYDDSANMEFYRVGQVAYPNKDQRDFVFEVRAQRTVPEGVTGEIAQVVRFEALDTDGPRGAELDSAAYAAVAEEDRGARDYYRQTVTGRQILVEEATWLELPPAERGPVRYYRWERPRLAELEVLTPGENIVALTQRQKTRATSLFANILRGLTTDGYFYTFYEMRPYDALTDRYQLEIDLGAKFWLDRVRLLSAESPLSAYQVRLSDGAIDPSGTRVWRALDERLNERAYLQLEEQFPLQQVRFIELRRLELLGAGSDKAALSELQAYGEGYVSEVDLTSPLIKLDGSRLFTDVTWEGEAPQDTRIEVRTRSGDDLRLEADYYDAYGRLISREQWEAAVAKNRGPVVQRELPGPRWSNWSEVYAGSGDAFRSPSPRRMAMVQVRLLTQNPERRARLGRLILGLAPPLVDQTFAEISPVRGVRPGQDEEFTLYVRPVFAPADPGFDRLVLRSSSSAPIELLSLTRASDAQLRSGTGQELLGQVEVEPGADGSVAIVFPEPVLGGSSVYVARFRTRVYLSGTTFGAELMRATRPGVVQVVSEGDAVTQVATQSLVVTADLERAGLLEEVEVAPAVLTPNGDGTNDETEISFAVYRVKGQHPLEVGIYDLAGRLVRDLSVVRLQPSGRHAVRWNGLDDGGRLVAPGIYVVRVRVPVDAGDAGTSVARLVHVAY
ncbi:MAG: FlgD immunoglobulin-like domain containing protein [Gemmatimonadota bacterium]